MIPYSVEQTQRAYTQCLALARTHYENFPVASRLLPPSLRAPVSVIYAFARSADDFADEGTHPPEVRLTRLAAYAFKLDHLGDPNEDDPIFIALYNVIQKHDLPLTLFHDLLRAFEQDVTKKRYADFTEILQYCRYSANPIGRLLLYLINEATEENLRESDAICSALQLINFYQDISQDYTENNRIYFPLDEMRHFGVTETHFRDRISDQSFSALYNHNLNRAKTLLLSGAMLGNRIPGRFGLQLRMMINGGLRVLKLLEKQKLNCFARPRLGIKD